MSGAFAGSRSIDDRRRRRLASETEPGDHAFDADLSADAESESSNAQESDATLARNIEFPLNRLISRRLWKHLLICFAAIGCAAWMLRLPPAAAALASSLDLTTRFFRALLLFVSAEMALLIAWVRSTNPNDFSGHYRVWRLAAASWCAMAIFAGTGAYEFVDTAISSSLEMQETRTSQVLWLLPTTVLGLAIAWKLMEEMVRSWLSLLAFFVAVMCGAILVVGCLNDLTIHAPEWMSRTSIIGATALFVSMQIHTWFVVHVSSEPPVTRGRRKRRFESAGIPFEEFKTDERGEADPAFDSQCAPEQELTESAENAATIAEESTIPSSVPEEADHRVQLARKRNAASADRVDTAEPEKAPTAATNSLSGKKRRKSRKRSKRS